MQNNKHLTCPEARRPDSEGRVDGGRLLPVADEPVNEMIIIKLFLTTISVMFKNQPSEEVGVLPALAVLVVDLVRAGLVEPHAAHLEEAPQGDRKNNTN